MKVTLALGGLLLTSLTFTGVAAAEPVVQGVALGVERVFGFTRSVSAAESGGTTNSITTTGFSLGSSRGSLASAGYSIPRLGVDFILPRGLSFGGAFGVATYSTGSETETDGTTVESDSDTTSTSLLIAPRVGYLIGINEHFGIWPRAGFTYLSWAVDGGNTDLSTSYYALTLEAPLVITPNKFFGFVATPAFDLGVGGSVELNGQESDADIGMNEFGITLGLFVVL